MADAKEVGRIAIRSWVTLGIGVTAAAVFSSPPLEHTLIYDRTAIAAGQFWRLWTGHLVHFNASHLFWDLAVFLPAGIWLEQIVPALTRWFYLLAPLLISLLLLALQPTLEQYAGLSGIAAGVLVLLALVNLRRDAPAPRWFWPAVLSLVAIKVVLELVADRPLFIRLDSGVNTVPLAHVGGITCALIALPAAKAEFSRRMADRRSDR